MLLLDEPTNHLDLPTIERLEQDLAGRRGGLVVVSHDRAFLSALGRTIWWLDRGRLRMLDQGFGAFEAWSEQILAAEEAELRKLDKHDRGRDRLVASRHHRAAQAQPGPAAPPAGAARASAPRRPAPQGGVKLAAATEPAGGQLVIEALAITKRFGDRTVVRDFSTRIMRGDRVGIIGPNGCGKTTLLRLLTGELAPDAGVVRLGADLAISAVDQRRDSLDPDATPWQTLCPAGGDQVMVQGRWRHVIGYLRDFLFRPEQARTADPRALGRRAQPAAAGQAAGAARQSAGARRADQRSRHGHARSAAGGPDRVRRHPAPGQPRSRLPRPAGDQRDRVRGRRPPAGVCRRLRRHLRQRTAPAPSARLPSAAPARRRPGDRQKGATPLRARGRAQRDLDRLLGQVEALAGEIRRLEHALADPDLFRRDHQKPSPRAPLGWPGHGTTCRRPNSAGSTLPPASSR